MISGKVVIDYPTIQIVLEVCLLDIFPHV